jgi:hydrogenase maturation protease
MTKVLVAGIGNELFGDDGFGVAVVRELLLRERRALPRNAQVTLMNAGTRGFDLACALSDGYDAAILIDAAPRGRSPGTLYVLEPAPAPPNGSSLDVWFDPHRLDPSRAWGLARAQGAPLSQIFVVGCEPAEQLEMSDQLSPAVAAAVEPAIEEVERLIRELAVMGASHA